MGWLRRHGRHRECPCGLRRRQRSGVYAAGFFTSVDGEPGSLVAKWDGTNWSALASGTSGTANALAVFDDGAGPALYVGGTFLAVGGTTVNRIAKWDGLAWSALESGMDGTVTATCRLRRRLGSSVHAGGGFTTAGGVPANRVAKWDGTNWSALGEGIAATFAGARVDAFAIVDDGVSPSLVAAGIFDLAGGAAVGNIAEWRCGEP